MRCKARKMRWTTSMKSMIIKSIIAARSTASASSACQCAGHSSSLVPSSSPICTPTARQAARAIRQPPPPPPPPPPPLPSLSPLLPTGLLTAAGGAVSLAPRNCAKFPPRPLHTRRRRLPMRPEYFFVCRWQWQTGGQAMLLAAPPLLLLLLLLLLILMLMLMLMLILLLMLLLLVTPPPSPPPPRASSSPPAFTSPQDRSSAVTGWRAFQPLCSAP